MRLNMPKAEFLMLAQKYDYCKHSPAGHYLSEKLNGQRWFWDGGLSRGILKSNVPWANNDKDSRYNELPVATGLWTRYGNVIHAPDWWLDWLPPMTLDGEGYTQRGPASLQELRSITSRIKPTDEWEKVTYRCFDVPSVAMVFSTRWISGINFTKALNADKIALWLLENAVHLIEHSNSPNRTFEFTYKILQRELVGNPIAYCHHQFQLPFQTGIAHQIVMDRLEQITKDGGEGLILRHPDSCWEPHRVATLLKVKGLQDSEAEVIGYSSGRLTDKGSKLLGLMGALNLRWRGKIFEISGFTEKERRLGSLNPIRTDQAAKIYAANHPGEAMPAWITCKAFPLGGQVTFQYRDLSGDGIPQEARYLRQPDAY